MVSGVFFYLSDMLGNKYFVGKVYLNLYSEQSMKIQTANLTRTLLEEKKDFISKSGVRIIVILYF